MSSLLLCLNPCYGIANPNQWTFCQQVWQIDKNIKEQIKIHLPNVLVIADDHKAGDPEFKFLPPHLDNPADSCILPHYKHQVLRKKHLSAIFNEHNRKLITGKYDSINLCGFLVSTDIVPTAINLLDWRENVSILTDCCGDFKPEFKDKGIEYLRLLGINIK